MIYSFLDLGNVIIAVGLIMGCCFTKPGKSEINEQQMTEVSSTIGGSPSNGFLKSKFIFIRLISVDIFFLSIKLASDIAVEIRNIYVAIYDYDARTDDDLTFRVGDLLNVLDKRFVRSKI